jgi:hypothetical protein
MAVPAGVITDALLIAVAASLDVAAEGGCPAQLEGAHQAELMGGESMLGTVGVAVAAEDVERLSELAERNLQLVQGG